MRSTITVRLGLWPGLLVAVFVLALSGAHASKAAAYYDGPALDTGLYLPDDPGFDGGPIYQPGVPGPVPPAADPLGPDTPPPIDASDAPAAGDAEASGDGPGNPYHQVLPKSVADLVTKMLKDEYSPCWRQISHPYITGDNFSASAVWAAMKIVKSSTPNGDYIAKVSRVGDGANGTVTIYPVFDTLKGRELFGDTQVTGLDRMPTADEYKALVILHEIAHLTGALTHDVPDPLLFSPSELKRMELDAIARFERKILTACLGFQILSGPDATPLPAPRQDDGGGGSGGGGFEDLPSDTPLPESAEPEIHFPEGDAPVLVLPDGQRIEEGQVGDPPEDDPGYYGDDGPYCGDYCDDDDGGWDDGGGDGGGGGGGWDDGGWDWDDGGWGGEDVPEPEAPSER
ncbi:MAG TPA: hypothetical protein VGF25_10550 [Thermoleophilaceae bacterium]